MIEWFNAIKLEEWAWGVLKTQGVIEYLKPFEIRVN